MKKEGEAGRRKISQYTRYGTVVLATVQAGGVAFALQNQQFGGMPVVIRPGPAFMFTAIVTLVAGTMFLMWLGEQVTERGIGNGISLLIFAGIVAGLPGAIGQSFESARQGDTNIALLLAIAVLAVLIVAFVVFVERGQRRITINYAKRQQGRQVFAAQTSHLPLKLNMAGVIPAIFASSLLLFPASLGQWFGQGEGVMAEYLQDFSMLLAPDKPLYLLLFSAGIIFFCYFYTAVTFNPVDVADNLKKGGIIIANTSGFGSRNLKLAKYDSNPLEDGSLKEYQLISLDIEAIVKQELKNSGISPKIVKKTKNFLNRFTSASVTKAISHRMSLA